MHSGNVTEQVEGIRRQTVAVLDDLIAKAGEFELADPPAALGRHHQKLDRGHDIEGGSPIGPRRQAKRPKRERARSGSSRPRRDPREGDRRRRT